jgi:glycerophosphoryl diester phosphodiesterase
MTSFRPRPLPGEPPYVIAHRGISGKAPENTLASFHRAAGTSGIRMIELDVRLSKDEEVIVLHDRTLQRTSTGNGPARNYTFDEIRRFDAGSWFHPMFSDERIPTLQEVLQMFCDRCWVDIEIKSDWLHKEPEGLIEDRVLDAVHRSGMEERVMFSSFDHPLLANLKRRAPSAVTGVLFNFPRDIGRLTSRIAHRADARVLVCAKHELTHRMVIDAHRHDIAVYVYTLNSLRDVRQVLAYGVDGIISNDADDIVDIVRNEQ